MLFNLNRLCTALVRIGCTSAVLFGGSAFAQNNFTDANEVIENIFTLDYSVGGVDQPQITNGPPGGGTGTTFTVDRRVDVLVESLSDTNVSPSATGQELVYRVRNDGNDNQSYQLDFEQLTGDAFDPTSVTARFYSDAGADDAFVAGTDDSGPGTAIAFGSGVTTDVAPDETIWVIVSATIPADAGGGTALVSGDLGGITLIADSFDPTAWIINAPTTANPGVVASNAGTETTAATTNVEDGAAQNVLVDIAGPATADNANDGSHSDTGNYVIALAEVTGGKTVAVINTDATAIDCDDFAVTGDNTQFAIPGACIEYTITVTNAASAASSATDIDIQDTLPPEVQFVDALAAGFTPAGTLTEPLTTCTSGCLVRLNGGGLGVNESGTVRIRATIR